MTRAKMVYISEEAHPRLKLLAARRNRPMGQLVVQADRYNRRRTAVVIAAITSSRAHEHLPCKLAVAKDSPEGRASNPSSL